MNQLLQQIQELVFQALSHREMDQGYMPHLAKLDAEVSRALEYAQSKERYQELTYREEDDTREIKLFGRP